MLAGGDGLRPPPSEMYIPPQIDIRPSSVDPTRMGIWCKNLIKKGQTFGPFVGHRVLDSSEDMDSTFVWEVVDLESKQFLFYIDATDPLKGNWMRYINCARYFEEQNIVSEQEGIDIFYRAIQDISAGSELLTWYEKIPMRKRKGRKEKPVKGKWNSKSRSASGDTRSPSAAEVDKIVEAPPTTPDAESTSAATSSTATRRSKRNIQRSKKFSQDDYIIDDNDLLVDSGENSDSEDQDFEDSLSGSSSSICKIKLSSITPSEPPESGWYQFVVKPYHIVKSRLGRRVFKCDICSGIYRYAFSLKRHYIRNHINYKYVSKSDLLNCSITTDMAETSRNYEQNNSAKSPESSTSTNSIKSSEGSIDNIGSPANSNGDIDTLKANGHHSSKVDNVYSNGSKETDPQSSIRGAILASYLTADVKIQRPSTNAITEDIPAAERSTVAIGNALLTDTESAFNGSENRKEEKHQAEDLDQSTASIANQTFGEENNPTESRELIIPDIQKPGSSEKKTEHVSVPKVTQVDKETLDQIKASEEDCKPDLKMESDIANNVANDNDLISSASRESDVAKIGDVVKSSDLVSGSDLKNMNVAKETKSEENLKEEVDMEAASDRANDVRTESMFDRSERIENEETCTKPLSPSSLAGLSQKENGCDVAGIKPALDTARDPHLLQNTVSMDSTTSDKLHGDVKHRADHSQDVAVDMNVTKADSDVSKTSDQQESIISLESGHNKHFPIEQSCENVIRKGVADVPTNTCSAEVNLTENVIDKKKETADIQPPPEKSKQSMEDLNNGTALSEINDSDIKSGNHDTKSSDNSAGSIIKADSVTPKSNENLIVDCVLKEVSVDGEKISASYRCEENCKDFPLSNPTNCDNNDSDPRCIIGAKSDRISEDCVQKQAACSKQSLEAETAKCNNSEGTGPQNVKLECEGAPSTKDSDKDSVKSDNTTAQSAETQPRQTNGKGHLEKGKTFGMHGLFRCNLCEALFDLVSQLKDHLSNHPSTCSNKSYLCDSCDMRFTHKQNLMRHQAVHSGSKPYVCKYCGKSFPTATNHKRHERIHLGRRFSCLHCTSSFTQSGDLKKHVRKLHPNAYHQCGFCCKYFPEVDRLEKHLLGHAKTLESNQTELFQRKEAFKVDIDTDMAESMRLADCEESGYKFACTICKKRYQDYANMCRHRRLAHHKPMLMNRGIKPSMRNFGNDDHSHDKNEVESFYCDVSKNISENLSNYLEGTREHLDHAADHIKIPSCDAQKIPETGNLKKFNFPQGYKLKKLSEVYAPLKQKKIRNGDIEIEKVAITEIMKSVTSENNPEEDAVAETVTETADDNSPDIKEDEPSAPATTPPPSQSQTESSAKSVDSGSIRIPEIHTCTICRCVFHNYRVYQEHMYYRHKIKVSNKDEDDNEKSENEEIKSEKEESQPTPENPDSVSKVQLAPSTQAGPLDLSLLAIDPQDQITVTERKPCENQVDPKTVAIYTKPTKFICMACYEEFDDRDCLKEHQVEKHPYVDCSHIEVDKEFQPAWSRQISAVGLLNVCTSQVPLPLEQCTKRQKYSCTQCDRTFTEVGDLHEHMLECADPKIRFPCYSAGLLQLLQKGFRPENKHKSEKRGEKRRKSNDSDSKLDQFVERDEYGRRKRRKAFELPYNPLNHIRRREFTEIVEVLKCTGCEQQFKTISLLERHIPACSEKNRIRDSTKEEESDEEQDTYDPNKHMCIYCQKQFTYMGMLKNHVFDHCVVRKGFVEQGEWVDDEWEDDIITKTGGPRDTLSRQSSISSGLNLMGEGEENEPEGSEGKRRGRKRRKKGPRWYKRNSSGVKSSFSKDSFGGSEDHSLSDRHLVDENSNSTEGSFKNDFTNTESVNNSKGVDISQLLERKIIPDASENHTDMHSAFATIQKKANQSPSVEESARPSVKHTKKATDSKAKPQISKPKEPVSKNMGANIKQKLAHKIKEQQTKRKLVGGKNTATKPEKRARKTKSENDIAKQVSKRSHSVAAPRTKTAPVKSPKKSTPKPKSPRKQGTRNLKIRSKSESKIMKVSRKNKSNLAVKALTNVEDSDDDNIALSHFKLDKKAPVKNTNKPSRKALWQKSPSKKVVLTQQSKRVKTTKVSSPAKSRAPQTKSQNAIRSPLKKKKHSVQMNFDDKGVSNLLHDEGTIGNIAKRKLRRS